MSEIKRIGQYEITELLGRGAMGEVYKAVDSKMFGRAVAIKLLSDRFTRNEQALTRFKREVEVAARLEHPNIVTIHDRGEHDGRPYFVMEFIDGTDLTTLIADHKSQKPENLLALAGQFCEAIEFAHTEGVIHRDIKPSNIMITQRGGQAIAKLVDFGIVHVERSNLTRSQTQPGTYSYMSPEQMGSDEVDNRSDLFSLGIVLYEMFTGVHPFEAATDLFIAQRIMGDEPEPPKQVESSLPTSLESLILKLLEKDPRQRPQTTAEVSAALRETRRRFMSRGVSDAGDYSNVEDMTRPMVENLVTFGRKKEAEGDLPAAVQAYEKASNLAPDVDRLERKIQKLKHRIESEKKLEEHVVAALEGIRTGDFEAAEEHRKNAWILSPESERVAELEREIREARDAASGAAGKTASASDSAVEAAVAGAQAEMDAGELDAARHRLVDAIRNYPDDVQARFLLDRVMQVFAWGGDYISYRKRLAEVHEALGGGDLETARTAWDAAKQIWPEDDEWKSLEREIHTRESSRIEGLLTRAEKLLEQAAGAADEESGLSLAVQAIEELEQARALGGDEARLSAPLEEARRLEVDLKRRVERSRADSEARQRQIAESLSGARSRLDAANKLHGETALDAYRGCRKLYSEIRQQAPDHPEPDQRIAEIDLAIERIERELGEAGEKAKEAERQLESARGILEEARTGGEGSVEQIDRVLRRLDEGKLFAERASQLAPGEHEARGVLEDLEAAESTLQRQRRLLLTTEQGLENGRTLMDKARNLVVEESVEELRRGETTCKEAEQAFRAVVTVDEDHEEAQEALKSLGVLAEHFHFEIQRREADQKQAEQQELELRNALLEAGALMDRAEAQAAEGESGAAGALRSCASIGEMLGRVAAIDADHTELLGLQSRRERLQKRLEAAAAEPAKAEPKIEPKAEPKKKKEKKPDAKSRRRRDLEKANKHLAEARALVESGKHREAGEILEDLDAACREREWLGELLPEIEKLFEKIEPVPAPPGRKVVVIAAAVIVPLVLTIGGWWMFRDKKEESIPKPPPQIAVKEPAKDSVTKPAEDPVLDSADDPVADLLTDPVADPVPELVKDPVPQPVPQPVKEPVVIETVEVTDPDAGKVDSARVEAAIYACDTAMGQAALGEAPRAKIIGDLQAAYDDGTALVAQRPGKDNSGLRARLREVEAELGRQRFRKEFSEVEKRLADHQRRLFSVDTQNLSETEFAATKAALDKAREFVASHPSQSMGRIPELIDDIARRIVSIDPGWYGIVGVACVPGTDRFAEGLRVAAVHYQDVSGERDNEAGFAFTDAAGRFAIPIDEHYRLHLIVSDGKGHEVRFGDRSKTYQAYNPETKMGRRLDIEPLCPSSK